MTCSHPMLLSYILFRKGIFGQTIVKPNKKTDLSSITHGRKLKIFLPVINISDKFINTPASWVLADAWAGVACTREMRAAAAVVSPGIAVQGADSTWSSEGSRRAPMSGLPSLCERSVAPEGKWGVRRGWKERRRMGFLLQHPVILFTATRATKAHKIERKRAR